MAFSGNFGSLSSWVEQLGSAVEQAKNSVTEAIGNLTSEITGPTPTRSPPTDAADDSRSGSQPDDGEWEHRNGGRSPGSSHGRGDSRAQTRAQAVERYDDDDEERGDGERDERPTPVPEDPRRSRNSSRNSYGDGHHADVYRQGSSRNSEQECVFGAMFHSEQAGQKKVPVIVAGANGSEVVVVVAC